MTAPPLIDAGDAIFLDLDGTIAPIEATPGRVRSSPRRNTLLKKLSQAQGGALAVLTGRTLEDADKILDSAVGAVGAVHGLVCRDAAGKIYEVSPSPGIATARAWLEPLVRSRPGLLIEDKGHALAVHYRRAPEAGAALDEACERIARLTGLIVQRGRMVCELRTSGPSKGDALRIFTHSAPFAGRRPLMVGDDLTDEPAFKAAAELGGFGVLVGQSRATAAQYGLETVEAVLDWLAGSLEARP